MKWKAEEVTNMIKKLFALKKSHSKLRWYVKEFSLLKNTEGEIAELKKSRIIDAINIFKEDLLNYAEIVEKSSDEFKQPIRNIPGVYFLVDSFRTKGYEIVYIGQARSIMNRLSGHFWKVEKKFDRVFYLELTFEELEKIESYYIWHLGYPHYNKDAGKNDYIVRKLLGISGLLTDNYLE